MLGGSNVDAHLPHRERDLRLRIIWAVIYTIHASELLLCFSYYPFLLYDLSFYCLLMKALNGLFGFLFFHV